MISVWAVHTNLALAMFSCTPHTPQHTYNISISGKTFLRRAKHGTAIRKRWSIKKPYAILAECIGWHGKGMDF
jgi:hypothetical protein